jgi:hypothetical protein
MFNFPGYKRYANQNYTKISSHSSKNGHIQGQQQQQMLARMQRNRNPYTLLVGMQINTTTMENIMESPQKAKDRTAI